MADEVRKCAIVSGAPVNDSEFLKNNIDLSSFIIAADSGYNKLLDANIRIDCIVADFDSSEKPDINCEMVISPIEKEATDTFNAVKLAVERGYNEITVYFALGGRFDHSFANLMCLDYCSKHGVNCILCDRINRVRLVKHKVIIKKDYKAFSLFAFNEDCYGVKIKGAYYTAGWYGKQSLDIKLGEQFAQSNYITEEQCEISLEKGTLLLIEANDV